MSPGRLSRRYRRQGEGLRPGPVRQVELRAGADQQRRQFVSRVVGVCSGRKPEPLRDRSQRRNDHRVAGTRRWVLLVERLRQRRQVQLTRHC